MHNSLNIVIHEKELDKILDQSSRLIIVYK